MKNNLFSEQYRCIYSQSHFILENFFNEFFNIIENEQTIKQNTPLLMREIIGETDFKKIKLLPKDSQSTISPLIKIGNQFIDIHKATHQKASKKQMTNEIHSYLKAFHLDSSILNFYIYQLSGGMIKKVAIIMALLQKPTTLIAYDLSTNLDSISIMDLFNTLEHLEFLPTIFLLTNDFSIIKKIKKQYLLNNNLSYEKITNQQFLDPLEELSEKMNIHSTLEKEILKLKNISYRVPSFKSEHTEILQNITFSIHKGEIVGLIGASGSGKTTISKIIANIYKPTSGHIEKIEHICMNIIFQNPQYSINQRLNVKDVIAEPLIIQKYKKNDIDQLIKPIWNYFELEPSLLTKKIYEVPLNIQQLIAIIRAFIINPHLLICDEIFTHLDLDHTVKVVELIHKKKIDDRVSFLIINHDLNLIKVLCDTTLIIDKGKIIEQQNTHDLIMKPGCFETKKLVNSYQWLTN